MTKSAPRSATPRTSAAQKEAVELKRPWKEFLRERGLHDSRTREAVVDLFLETDGHVELQELFDRARKRDPGLGFATVYRTMKLLEEAGIANVRHFSDQKGATYEVAAGRSHHDHLICEGCGKIVEFVDDRVERLQDGIAAEHGFTLTRHRHELYGSCSRCRSDKKVNRG